MCDTTAWPLQLTSGLAPHCDLQASFICYITNKIPPKLLFVPGITHSPSSHLRESSPLRILFGLPTFITHSVVKQYCDFDLLDFSVFHGFLLLLWQSLYSIILTSPFPNNYSSTPHLSMPPPFPRLSFPKLFYQVLERATFSFRTLHKLSSLQPLPHPNWPTTTWSTQLKHRLTSPFKSSLGISCAWFHSYVEIDQQYSCYTAYLSVSFIRQKASHGQRTCLLCLQLCCQYLPGRLACNRFTK